MEKKAYGIQLAEELFHIFCGYFQEDADCVVCYEYGGREVFFRATMPEDEAAFYRRDFSDCTENVRTKENKTVWIWNENGALRGMWVLEIHSGSNEEVEDSCRKMVSLVQAAFSACLLAEELRKEQLRDCVTGLFGNRVFEETLQQFMDQGMGGHLIVARCPVRYCRPYEEDGLNRSAKTLAGACKKSGVPYIYRIAEDTVALLCLDGQERAYAVAQEMADVEGTDLYVAEFAALENGKIYSMIQQNLDRIEEDGTAFGLHYPYPRLPIFKDYPEGGQNGEREH